MKLVSLWLLVAGLASIAVQAAEKYPPLPAPADASQWGRHIQRTMGLLATSTPQRRHRVRILFYGQSITAQKWWKLVAEDLQRRFPHADLDVQNRAIGGFASQLLVRTAEHDLYPFYPDLLIFHVYGDHRRYEDIIRLTRERTAAEVAIFTDHVTAKEAPDANGQYVDEGWTAFMAGHIAKVAAKYGCERIDVRPPWKRYLLDNKLASSALLKDGVHLNEHGEWLMAGLVSRQLVYRPELMTEQSRRLVRTVEVGKDAAWDGDRLLLPFEGNRVDALAAADGDRGSAEVRIDGKRPSEWPACYCFTRPSTIHNTWPAVIRVSWRTPLMPEDWRARILETDEFGKRFRFEVVGSKTGPDGEGTSEASFVSKSGRVVIEPGDWHLERTSTFRKQPVPKGFETRWSVRPMFVDTCVPPKADDPAREYPTTLAQGLPNGRHTLELRGRAAIRALRIYRPPFEAVKKENRDE